MDRSKCSPGLLFMYRFSTELNPKCVFCVFQYFFLRISQIFACSVDVKCQHGHGWPVRGAFATWALFCWFFERLCNGFRILRFEDILFQVQCVAVLCYVPRPFVNRLFVWMFHGLFFNVVRFTIDRHNKSALLSMLRFSARSNALISSYCNVISKLWNR